MHPSVHAETHPHKPAIVMAGSGATVTFAELDQRSNQGAHLLRSLGLAAGDCLAILMENSPTYFEIAWAAQRSGLYFACISTKLTAGEISYILEDSRAKVLIASPTLAAVAKEAAAQSGVRAFSADGDIEGFERFETARTAMPTTRIADESAGADMLYSSGTTGRPKGVKVALTGAPIDADNALRSLIQGLYGIDQSAIYLSPAPLYHAAPLRWCMTVQKMGATTIIMERFEPEAFLALVEKHRVTAAQMVPTMFVRMLKLAEDVRRRYDVSSLRGVIHAAAPCPIPIKEQMIAWWGPIVYEYYAGTEGNGFCSISSPEWLTHKGSVGKALVGSLRICDETGAELPAGEAGTVYFADGSQFEYHNDPKKTAESRHPANPTWTTLGDVGYVDADGYLYLTDRKAFMIITGGVNVYPQEIENLLVTHPKVADAAVFGVPNDDFGEEVKAVIQPLRWSDSGADLAEDLLAFCRAHLSHVKCPRSIDFLEELPRHPTGKLYKRLLRDQYWAGRGSKI
jgi:long-chain acyl-CoA synthetase